MKKYIVLIFFGLVLSGCTKTLDEAIQKSQSELEASKAKQAQLVETSNELIKYSDCIIAAADEKAMKACDEMKKTFSAATQQKMAATAASSDERKIPVVNQ